MMHAIAWIGLLAGPAAAGDFSFSFGLHKTNHHGRQVALGIQVNRPEVRPAPVLHVPATYRTVSERIWVPTTETVYRDVPVLDTWGNTIAYRRETQVIQSGYWKTIQRQVLVRPAHTVVLTPGGHRKHRVMAVAHSRPLSTTRTFARAACY
jgi:hypothetical protein